jgi:hypothetical protein
VRNPFKSRHAVCSGNWSFIEYGRVAWLVRTGGFRHPMPNRWLPVAVLGGGVAAGTLLRSLTSFGLPVALPAGVAGIWLGALLVDRFAYRSTRRGPPSGGGDPSGDRAPRPHAPFAGAGAAAIPLPGDRDSE